MSAVWCHQCGCRQSLGVPTCGDRNATGELGLPYAISFFSFVFMFRSARFLTFGPVSYLRIVYYTSGRLCAVTPNTRCRHLGARAAELCGGEGGGGLGFAGVARSRPVAMARGGHVAGLTRGAGRGWRRETAAAAAAAPPSAEQQQQQQHSAGRRGAAGAPMPGPTQALSPNGENNNDIIQDNGTTIIPFRKHTVRGERSYRYRWRAAAGRCGAGGGSRAERGRAALSPPPHPNTHR